MKLLPKHAKMLADFKEARRKHKGQQMLTTYADITGVSVYAAHYHFAVLIEKGLVLKTGYGVYELTQKAARQ